MAESSHTQAEKNISDRADPFDILKRVLVPKLRENLQDLMKKSASSLQHAMSNTTHTPSTESELLANANDLQKALSEIRSTCFQIDMQLSLCNEAVFKGSLVDTPFNTDRPDEEYQGFLQQADSQINQSLEIQKLLSSCVARLSKWDADNQSGYNENVTSSSDANVAGTIVEAIGRKEK